MSFLADAGYTGKLDFDVTDIGTMALHIGANEDQKQECVFGGFLQEPLH